MSPEELDREFERPAILSQRLFLPAVQADQGQADRIQVSISESGYLIREN